MKYGVSEKNSKKKLDNLHGCCCIVIVILTENNIVNFLTYTSFVTGLPDDCDKPKNSQLNRHWTFSSKKYSILSTLSTYINMKWFYILSVVKFTDSLLCCSLFVVAGIHLKAN